jgi:pimeloyl-ACP methyl ester carboxylesterase
VGAAVLQMTVPDSVSQSKVSVAGLGLRVLRKGTGPPLIAVHGSLGNLGWLPFYEQLAESYTVHVPDVPGYGQSDRPDWARSPRDLAILLQQLLDVLGLADVTLVGMGFGGFLAAEMASMNQARFVRMVLVGATGIRPREGEIADQMLIGFPEWGLSGFRDLASFRELFGVDSLPDDLYSLWDLSTEMTARVCWKPWMFSDQLPHLLSEVRVPTLLVWGEHDRLVPIDIGRQYQSLLPNAELEIVADAGHVVDLEAPEILTTLIRRHASSPGGTTS